VLACGLGHPCLRGPHPVRLSAVPAQFLMLASCNSLRLAGSSLTSDFNLALEFLDGLGRAYVGSTRFQSPGAVYQAFLSGLASGLTLSQSTNVANAFVSQSGLDLCTFVSIGNPDDSIVGPRLVNASVDGASILATSMEQEVTVRIDDTSCGANLMCAVFS